MATIYRVLSTPVWVRSEPSVNGEILGVIYKDEQVEAETQIGMWIKHSTGYSCLKDSSGKDLFEKVEQPAMMMFRMTRSAISVGMAVRINQSADCYTNAGAGIKIPQWVKDRTHIVSQISSDGQRVLLGHPSGINSWVYMKDVSPADGSSSNVTVEPVTNYEEKEYVNDYRPDLAATRVQLTDSDLMNSLNNGLRVHNLRGIHGMPYQFMPICDTRISNHSDAFGRKYAEKIVARIPLLLMTPGNPVFLKKFSKETKKSFIQEYINLNLKGAVQSELDEIISRESKFYSLDFAYIDYYNFVNPMCRAAARFLGIHNVTLDGTKLDNYNWYENTNADLQKILPYRGCVPFYIHSDNQVNETFSNSTTESLLASKTNSMSDLGREINFIIGDVTASTGINFDKLTSDIGENLENISEMADKMLSSGNIFTNIANNIRTVASGGKLIFPEIWSDSDFSRSYSVKIKLTTPDNDKLSWYLNICVPLIHLIGLVAPRQSSVNGFISPFLIRAFYKGLFNVDMGIITSMSVSKGEEGAWTKEGLPTVVDVDFDIKDLYSALTITSNDSNNYKYNMMNNIILMDYLANMCGININEPDIGRTIDMYFTQNVQNKIVDAVRMDLFGSFDQWATNTMMDIYSKFSGR